MPSLAFQIWVTRRAEKLDEIVQAHRSVGGISRGRRYATLQINHAYTVLVSSQFQGFCRDLHTECVRHLSQFVGLTHLQITFRAEFTRDRKLDHGNPTPGHLGADFNRIGLSFWDEIKLHDARTPRRMELLEEMNQWRNAIAHQNFDRLGGSDALTLKDVAARPAVVSRSRLMLYSSAIWKT